MTFSPGSTMLTVCLNTPIGMNNLSNMKTVYFFNNCCLFNQDELANSTSICQFVRLFFIGPMVV
jgi:hypothetical protein